MKKRKLLAVMLTLFIVLITGNLTVSAKGSNSVKQNPKMHLKETRKIKIDKENTALLNIYKDDKGAIIYCVDELPDDSIIKEKALKYINELMKTGNAQETTVYVDNEGASKIYSGSDYDTSKMSSDANSYVWSDYYYKWKYEVDGCIDKTWGGSSAGWYGSAQMSQMLLKQSMVVDVTGIGISISWPPSFTINDSTYQKSWVSQPLYSTVNGAEIEPAYIDPTYTAWATAVTYITGADIYVTGYPVLKPQSYLKFAAD